MTRLNKFIPSKAFALTILSVAIPLMLQQLITTSVNLIDNLMVGQLGDYAIGAVSSVNRFYIISTFSTNGVLAACAIYIAQYFGAENEEKMKETFRFSIWIAILFGFVFMGIGYLGASSIMHYFTPYEEVISLGTQYLKIICFGFIPLAISSAIATSMRSIGKTKTPMYISAVAVILNTLLNYCLIFGHFGFPTLGVIGAAIATLLARIVEVVIYIVVTIRRKYPFTSALKYCLHIPTSLVKRIMIKAAPLAFNEVLWSFGTATLFKFYSTRGVEVMSGYSISTTISDIFFILAAGMAAATTILISQPLGANRLEEARDNAYKIMGFTFCLSILFGCIMMVAANVVPNFYQVSELAKQSATAYLQVMSVLFWIYLLNAQCYFILRAGGDTKSTLMMDAGYMWTVNMPIVFAFTYYSNVSFIVLYMIGQTTDVIKLVIAYRFVKKEKWVVNLAHHHE